MKSEKKKCPKCKSMIDKRGFWKHKQHCDGTLKHPKTDRRVFVCNYCDTSPKSKSGIYQHLKKYHSEMAGMTKGFFQFDHHANEVEGPKSKKHKNKKQTSFDKKIPPITTVFADLQIEIDIVRAFRKGCIKIVQN